MGLPEGYSFFYQGYPCTPLVSVKRSLGLEPDLAVVHVAREDFGKFQVTSPDVPADAITFYTDDKEPKTGFLTYGALKLAEVIDNDENAVTFRHMILSERAVESLVATDSTSDIAKLELVDIRALWSAQGFVCKSINVPRAGLEELGAGQVSGGTRTAGVAGTPDQFLPGSLDAGKFWTLRRVLETIVLPALPGAPILYRMPIDLEFAEPRAHVWDVELAKTALKDLLDEFNLQLALNPDASVSLWHVGEGDLSVLGLPLSLSDPRVTETLELIAHNYTPSCVTVYGPPIIEVVKEELEAVGEDSLGRIVPLARALEQINVPFDKFALITHEERIATKVPPDRIRAFERWAFKWYRIKNLKTQDDRLPVLDRARTDNFRPAPPKVTATSVQPVNVGHFLRRADIVGASNAQGSNQSKPPDAPESTSQKVADVLDVLTGLKFARVLLGSEDAKKAADEAKAEAAQARADAANAQIAAGHINQITQDLREKQDLGLVVFANLPPDDADGDYTIDRERGIVMFHEPRFEVIETYLPVADSKVKSAKVTMEWGYTHKPASGTSVSLENRYSSTWIVPKVVDTGREPGRAPPKVAPKKLDTPPKGYAPLPIGRPDLQQYVEKGDGGTKATSNKAQLDSLAADIAAVILSQPKVTPGLVVKIARPLAIPNTGRVKSLEWSCDVDRPLELVAHLAAFAPFAPLPAGAKPPVRHIGRDSSAKDATNMPRGLKK